MDEAPVLQMTSIRKSFGGVPVLKGVDLRLERGRVLGLLGENGAGKSTLIKILCGVHEADGGTIAVDGAETRIKDAAHAQSLGIRTVYQELSLFPALRVYENIFLRTEPLRGPASIVSPINTREMIRRSRQILRDVLGIELDVTLRVEELTLAEQQLVEIARAVRSQARVLVLDEPTTTLEEREKNQLFEVVRDLAARGTSVVFISHHLDEVLELCDRTTILRDGEVVLDRSTAGLDARAIIAAMSGKAPENQYPKAELEIGETVLSVRGLTRARSYQDVSFDLRRGEILGIAGLVGCGKSDLIRTIFGQVDHDGGTISLHGEPVRIRRTRDAMRRRISYVPSDRKVDGIFPERSVEWNMTISALRRVLGRFGISAKKERATVAEGIRAFGVRLASARQEIAHLSGGNQQKVLLARSLLDEPEILLLEEPTRGIDVNAKTEVYEIVTDFVRRGNSVILVSSEETELTEMSDRVLVMREGRIRKELDREHADVDTIKLYAMSDH
jgi:ribose transport system ATP-binding protein